LSRVYWIERSAESVPDHNDWLSAQEVSQQHGFRIEKRRTDWRLGRWTAKHAIARYMELEPLWQVFSRIEIKASSAGVPQAFFREQSAAVAISLSHSGGKAICAIALNEFRLGCDIELVEPRADCFVNDYFTREEQLRIEHLSPSLRPTFITLFWSAKESTLKALGTGLRRDTRSVSVNSIGTNTFGKLTSSNLFRTASPPTHCWLPLETTDDLGGRFGGWWRCSEGFVRTVIADTCVDAPVELPEAVESISTSPCLPRS
jgi:4'-phosphopantetheinyl transferase